MASIKFKPAEREYVREEEIQRNQIPRADVSESKHPLSKDWITPAEAKKQQATPLSSSKSSSNPLDPLSSPKSASSPSSSSSSSDAFDPLRAGSKSKSEDKSDEPKDVFGIAAYKKRDQNEDDGFVPWKAKKAHILATYTTDEVVGINASFLNDFQAQVNLPVDKQQMRLDQLDESEERQQKEDMKIKQNDYIKHMERLNEQLGEAWDNEERVKSLKIAIQCAKVLSDTTVIKFYPSKWVLITEILDTFGDLVFKRILNRSIVVDPSTGVTINLPANFTPKDVPDIARETCRNWFFKIASIRELLPRLYVEMAIIRCYSFLSQNSYKEVINRLCMMTRGIGDPLVAAFTRAYLARKGREVAPQLKDFLITSFDDYLYTHSYMMQNEGFLTNIKKQIDTVPNYVSLFSPAVDWILQCIAHKSDKETFKKVIRSYGETSTSLVLHHILANFQPEFIAENALSFAKMIRESEGDTFPKYKLYATFGVNLGLCPPSKEDILSLLNDVWKVVTKITEPKEYITVAEVWIEYPVKHCTKRETNTLLGDIIKHIKENKSYEQLQLQLQSVVQKILATYHDFSVIFGMSNFLPLLDLCMGNTQVEVNKAILEVFCKYQPVTRDPVIINSMFTVGKIVHDSVNSLTFQDEIRQISRLIASFISKIEFGKEVEKHLNFYVDCRRAFANLDNVKSHLVLGVCNLAMKTLKLIGGTHNKKTASFVRACVAYCFITIPSMDDVFSRLNLYLLSAQVALMNQCLPQADSLFKAAITLIKEVPTFMENFDKQVKSTEDQLVGYIQNLCAALVVAPGHPEFGAFYLIQGLTTVVDEYKWEPGSIAKSVIYLSIVQVYCAQAQTRLPYHIDQLESNDVLYGGDYQTAKEVEGSLNKLLEGVLEQIKTVKEEGPTAVKSYRALVLLLFSTILSHGELNAESASFVGKLFLLAKENGAEKGDMLAAVKTAKAKASKGKLNAGLYEKLQTLV